MLTINLLPWRERARVRQKNLFRMVTALSIVVSAMIGVLTYRHFEVELVTMRERIHIITKKSEKYVNTSDDALTELHKTVNKIRRNQDQLKKLLHTMFVYSAISWGSIEVQKGVIKIYGVANMMTSLLSFMDYCEKKFNFNIVIKSIKILSPFDAIEFQVQVDRFGAGLNNNGMD